MASWVDISDAVIAAGKAIKAITIRQLRDNITAMAEGAAGAPRINGKAVQYALPVTATTSTPQTEENRMLFLQVLAAVEVYQFKRVFGTVLVTINPTDLFTPFRLYQNGILVHEQGTYGIFLKLLTIQEGDVLTSGPGSAADIGIYVDDKVVEFPPIAYASELP